MINNRLTFIQEESVVKCNQITFKKSDHVAVVTEVLIKRFESDQNTHISTVDDATAQDPNEQICTSGARRARNTFLGPPFIKLLL